MDKRDILASYALKYRGDWSQIAKAIREKESPERVPEENYITVYDDIYPDTLRELRFPPWVIFYRGDISLLDRTAVTVVGSRNICRYGRDITEMIVSVLSEEFVTVSGLAKGVDACAHQTAIKRGGKTIGVIGSGLGTVYPSANRSLYQHMYSEHLVISEYPYDVGVRRRYFPWRNRILAALGSILIVTQAEEKSGTMLTVNEAISLSRDIYCVPYPPGDPAGAGCNRLISQGAMILYTPEQLNEIKLHKNLQKG